MKPVRDLVTLVRAGVVRPMRPDRLVGVLAGYARWDVTVAWGYAMGAARHPDGAGTRTSARELLDAPEPVDAAPLVEAPGPGEDTDPGAFEDRHDPDLLSELLAHEEPLKALDVAVSKLPPKAAIKKAAPKRRA